MALCCEGAFSFAGNRALRSWMRGKARAFAQWFVIGRNDGKNRFIRGFEKLGDFRQSRGFRGRNFLRPRDGFRSRFVRWWRHGLFRRFLRSHCRFR
jgi:hypothetical protein